MGSKYIAFVLSAESRQDLLKLFPPKYVIPVCHHITLSFDDASAEILAWLYGEFTGHGEENVVPTMAVTEHCVDNGIECFRAAIVCHNNEHNLTYKHTRCDGKTYHITHSLDFGKHARDSCQVVSDIANIKRQIVLHLTGTVELLDHEN